MEALLSLGLVGLSALASWYFTQRYYRKATADLQGLVDRLPQEVVTALRNAEEREYTLDELEDLVLQYGYPTQFGIVPHKCPECGSNEIETYGTPGNEYVDPEMAMRCRMCGWVG